MQGRIIRSSPCPVKEYYQQFARRSQAVKELKVTAVINIQPVQNTTVINIQPPIPNIPETNSSALASKTDSQKVRTLPKDSSEVEIQRTRTDILVQNQTQRPAELQTYDRAVRSPFQESLFTQSQIYQSHRLRSDRVLVISMLISINTLHAAFRSSITIYAWVGKDSTPFHL
ncbi:Hypothetical_protein [Hexamita inflata]|uniref:Hypothetical_protein n=1 Tax=Hexamita inflata TaxID=28002 RepID=A0AA86NQK8_9EUKA|nr:Hypothetical protein HINF_LOCUS11259 [Hexamita inflata]